MLVSGFDLLPYVILVKIFLSDLAPAVTTEVNTEAAEVAEITAQVIQQVMIAKKVVVMLQGAMNPALEVIFPHQETNITVAIVVSEVVRRLLLTQDMQAKSAKNHFKQKE